jgi:anti-sigma-K factor RskA
MSEQELLELVPLAALGALDGAEREAFLAALPTSPRLQAELEAFEQVAAQLPLALPEARPARRALERRLPWLPWLAAAAAVVFALGALVARNQRDLARRDAREARERVASLAEVNARLERDLAGARMALAEARSVRQLVANPELRWVALKGQQPAPAARACVLYDAAAREAMLVVSQLSRAPEGRAYQVWLISGPRPTPAGMFQVDEEGTALVWLPPLESAQAFAVSLEPAAGVPAPTGPIVLAGDVGR